jgi:hypothetical protein
MPGDVPEERATDGILDLGAEARRKLALEEGESARLLSSGPHTWVLERVSDRLVGLPGDRELVLSADVRAFSLADVMHLVHAPGKSGFLHFEHAGTEKGVYLNGGEVVFACSNQRVDRLGESLVRRGVLERAHLLEAQEAYRPPAPLGRLLVALGMLTSRQLWEGVKAQVEEIVRSLFAFGAGSVLFFEGEVRPDNVVRLSLPTQRLVEEGLDQRDRLLEFLAFLEGPRMRVEAVDGAAERLEGMERAIVEAAAAPVGFAAMCRGVGVDPLSGARTVQLLDEMGAVRLSVAAQTAEARSDAEDLRACVRRHAKLLAELAAPIVAVEGASGLEGRLSAVAAETATRHPELLADVSVGPGGVLDPEALVDRALRFPGDRDREVRLAFGELVSYLEFELVNHPDVDDAQAFLDALEPLRSEL